MSRPNPKGHPARFSDEVVDLFVEIINHEVTDWFNPPILWDPYAGTGEALADIADRCRVTDAWPLPYGGTEIEAEFIVDPRVIIGDATFEMNYPPRLTAAGVLEGNGRWICVTSPVYPNGVADNHAPQDASKRYFYRKTKIDLTGNPSAELHVNNMGRYGYRGTKRGGISKRRAEYWRIARESVVHWSTADMVLLNVSDFKHSNGQIEPLVTDWRCLLKEHGWTHLIEHPVATARMRNGANADQRAEHEVIVVAKR